MGERPGGKSMAFHRTSSGEPRVLYMHPEKLIAWLLRAFLAMALFIWQSHGAENAKTLERVERKLDTAISEAKLDHDTITRLYERGDDQERRLRRLEHRLDHEATRPSSIAPAAIGGDQ